MAIPGQLRSAARSATRRASGNATFRKLAVPVYRTIMRQGRSAPPKVVAMSMPKAGTHLLSRVLNLLPAMRFSGYHLSEEHVTTTTDRLDLLRIEGELQRFGTGRFMTAHFPYDPGLMQLFANTGTTPLLILRDPRDVAVSYVHYVTSEPRHFHYDFYNSLATFDDRLQVTLEGFTANQRAPLGLHSMPMMVQRYQPWLTSGIEVVRFEDLIGPKGGGTVERQRDVVRRIADAVDRPLSSVQVERVCDRAFSTGAATFRSGQANGWPDHFASWHLDWCREALDPLIEDFGYAQTA